jgi:hypothetical protein
MKDYLCTPNKSAFIKTTEGKNSVIYTNDKKTGVDREILAKNPLSQMLLWERLISVVSSHT